MGGVDVSAVLMTQVAYGRSPELYGVRGSFLTWTDAEALRATRDDGVTALPLKEGPPRWSLGPYQA